MTMVKIESKSWSFASTVAFMSCRVKVMMFAGVLWRHLYHVFTYIYSLLIERETSVIVKIYWLNFCVFMCTYLEISSFFRYKFTLSFPIFVLLKKGVLWSRLILYEPVNFLHWKYPETFLSHLVHICKDQLRTCTFLRLVSSSCLCSSSKMPS